MKTALLYLLLFFPISIFAQGTSFQKDLMLTIGYFLSLEEQLKQIPIKYPELSKEVETTKLLWKIAFGDATENIEKQISDEIGEKSWDNLKKELLNQLIRPPLNRTKSVKKIRDIF